MIYVGGGVAAAAKRAARLGDGFYPSSPDPDLRAIYRNACEALDKSPGPILEKRGAPQFVFVTDDPEQAWHYIQPHALYETNFYARLQTQTGVAMPFQAMADSEALKESGLYKVVTPDECISLAHELENRGCIMTFNPTLAGLDEKLSWSSLELFQSKVLPYITPSAIESSGSCS